MARRPERGAAPRARARGDTLDRIWSYAGEPSEDERWAAAFGTAPDDFEPPTSAAHDLPLARVDALDWDAPRIDDDRAEDRGVTDPTLLDESFGDEAPDGAPVDDDRTRDHVPVGTRPRSLAAAAEASSGPRRRGRLTAVGAAVGVAALVTVALAGAAIARGSGGDADATRPAADRPDCAPATRPAADVDRDGCPESLLVDGSTIDAGVARWTLGEPGDMVTVGDWDCDGEASAALLRPASGDVFVFGTWAELDQPVTVSAVDQVVGRGGDPVRARRRGRAAVRPPRRRPGGWRQYGRGGAGVTGAGRAAATVRLAAWSAVLVAVARILVPTGRGSLSVPLGSADDLADWVGAASPAEMAMAVLRLLALAACGYLLAVTTLGVVARLVRGPGGCSGGRPRDARRSCGGSCPGAPARAWCSARWSPRCRRPTSPVRPTPRPSRPRRPCPRRGPPAREPRPRRWRVSHRRPP